MLAAYIIPILLLTITLLLYKKCFIFTNWNGDIVGIPRLGILGLYLLSLFPFVGYATFITIAVYPLVVADEMEIKDNKFTRYWLKK